MRERIDIIVDDSRLSENPEKIERLEKTEQFMPVDRIPVVVMEGQWVPLVGRGVQYKEYVAGAKENMREQILNLKWRFEHIKDDLPIETKCLKIEPDLGALRGIEFPLEVKWLDNQPPKSSPMLHEPEQIDTLSIPDPNTGISAKQIAWYKEMCSLQEEFDVRLNGQSLDLEVGLNHFGGPIPSAFALAGTNLFEWALTEPERMHRLMDIVTESFCNVVAYYDDLTGRNPDHPQPMGADTAELLGPDTFREMVVPYYQRIWERYKGTRLFHMCGKIDHLLDLIRDDLQIDLLDNFGFPVEVQNLKDKMAGRVRLLGGPSPILVLDGPVSQIIEEGMRYIQNLGPAGGFTLAAGGDIAPGTPIAHYDALVEASKEVGWPVGV